MAQPPPTDDELIDEIVRLGPWHLEVEVNEPVSTSVRQSAEPSPEQTRWTPAFIDPRQAWRTRLSAIYPSGLEGRTLLDCACNSGGYSFWSKELGSGGGLGFDARQHWIAQARFLQANRAAPSNGLRFEVCDVYDLDHVADVDYDISLFKGLFYHLPDPIHALKIVADRTRELLIVNTAARNDLPDGALISSRESVEHPMSGIHGLCWFPTGPRVVAEILASIGFAATRTTFWYRESPGGGPPRLEVIGAREEAILQNYDRRRPLGPGEGHAPRFSRRVPDGNDPSTRD